MNTLFSPPLHLTPRVIRLLAYPGMPIADVNVWTAKLDAACQQVDITTPRRLAHFLSQISHESGGLLYMRELWGPTPAQLGYEGRLDLGNTQPGDGQRYLGRGPLQLTGRANYRACGGRIGYPLEAQPELVEQIGVGSLTATDYWTTRNLNLLADLGGAASVPRLTRRVNGGLNGLDDRLRRYRLIAPVLGAED